MDVSAPKIETGSVCHVPYALAGFGGALVSDWAHGVPCATQFFPPRGWREVVTELGHETFPRAELAETLHRSSLALGAPEASLNNILKLARPTAYAVITGQQAGFLGGPLLTIYKALTAVKLARQYEQEAAGSAQFVPVFWVAGDDHDSAEIDHAYFLREDAKVGRITATLADGSKGRSASDLFLTRDEALIRQLGADLETFGGSHLIAAALTRYESKSFESAFSALLLEWLGATGLIVARSSDLRRFGAELYAQNVDDYDIVSRLIQEAGVALRKCSYEPGFSEKLRSGPFFFFTEKEGAARGAIIPEMNNGQRMFRVRDAAGQLISRAEMLDRIAREPQRCTAAAALRPILQQKIFPVAAAVLGPGEMAYWAQLRKVHEHYGAVWPVIVPRASLTLIDALGEKAVRKLGMSATPQDLFLSKKEWSRRISTSGELGGKIAAHTDAILKELDGLQTEIHRVDGGLDSMLGKLRSKVEFELSRVAQKAAASADQRGTAKASRADYLSALVRPENEPQERVLCCAQMMLAYPDLPERLLSIIDPGRHEHMVATL